MYIWRAGHGQVSMGCLDVVCFIAVCADGPHHADRQLLHHPLPPCCGLWFDEASCSPIASSRGTADRISRADEHANVDIYLFYLPSVLRMVSVDTQRVDTQRVETGPVKCNSITKAPFAPSGLASWALGRPQPGPTSQHPGAIYLVQQPRPRGLLAYVYCTV